MSGPADEFGPGHFVEFFTELLASMGLAELPTWQQEQICLWMDNGPDRQLTEAFRGVGKTWIAAALGMHRLYLDPINEKVLVTGSTGNKAREITTFMERAIRDCWMLKHLQPDGTRTSVEAFDVAGASNDPSPSVRSDGIFSPGLTGKRCTIAIVDDIETLSNSITPLRRARLAAAFTEITNIIKPAAEGCLPRRIIVLGTPHYETSFYLELVRNRGYQAQIWPARYPDINDPEQFDCYEGNLCKTMLAEIKANPSLIGQPTDPERFPEEELLIREAENTKASWQMQFMLNCRLSTLQRHPILLGDLIVMPLDHRALPGVVGWSNADSSRIRHLTCTGMGADRYYHSPSTVSDWVPRETTWRCVLAIDPSARGKDELAWTVLAELNGNLFLLENGGAQDGIAAATLNHLAALAIRWRVTSCVSESNYGGGMFGNILQPVMVAAYAEAVRQGKLPKDTNSVTVEELRSQGQKEARIIETLAPLIQQHRIVVREEVLVSSWREAERDPETGHERSLPYQLSRITADRGSLTFDDRLDSLEIAARFFTAAAVQDQEVAARKYQDEIETANLRAWFGETAAGIDGLAMGFHPKHSGVAVSATHRWRVRPDPKARGVAAGAAPVL